MKQARQLQNGRRAIVRCCQADSEDIDGHSFRKTTVDAVGVARPLSENLCYANMTYVEQVVEIDVNVYIPTTGAQNRTGG